MSYFPISAFYGDNIVTQSENMSWYDGSSLLEFLETVQVRNSDEFESPRFQVQYVIRPQTDALHDYRGYAGEIISGVYKRVMKLRYFRKISSQKYQQLKPAENQLMPFCRTACRYSH